MRNKERKQTQEERIKSIQKIDCQCAETPMAELSLKTKYDLLSIARFYEPGEKVGQHFAQQLKSKSSSKTAQ